MPHFPDRCIARLAHRHAARTFAAFARELQQPLVAQESSLRRALRVVAGSAYAAQWGLTNRIPAAAFRKDVPLQTFEDVRPWIERVAAGETTAFLHPSQRPLMFASSSGTTSKPKWIPVTPAFVADYRLGWNTFGVKMLTDHPDAILRAILQSSGREDAQRSPAGIPVGAITGLMARMQKRIVRRYYVGSPAIARIEPPEDRYYALMRMAIARDVAFAITANPATLVQLAKVADARSETLLRDVHDGTLTLSAAAAPPSALRIPRPNADRARALEQMRARSGRLRPADYWRLSFLACWTGGSLSHNLPRVHDLYGPLPIRDIGLLASEGRITIPLGDDTPSGVLDVRSALFEFIPVADNDLPHPTTLLSHELQTGADYAVVLSNTTGLLRYRLNDVVRVTGWHGPTPALEFRYRAGRVSSMAGEKLTEQQVVAAVRATAAEAGLAELDFALVPRWTDPPGYCLCHEQAVPPTFAVQLDFALARQNEEYELRRKSNRLRPLEMRLLSAGTFQHWDAHLLAGRGGTPEQYKRPALLLSPAETDALQTGISVG